MRARVGACTILRIFFKKNQLSYLEYFSKVNFEKNLTLQIFLIFKCAHSRAHKNQKIHFFYARAWARVPYLEYFSKKNQLSYLEYFSKVNFEKNLTLEIFNFDFLNFDFDYSDSH